MNILVTVFILEALVEEQTVSERIRTTASAYGHKILQCRNMKQMSTDAKKTVNDLQE